MTQTIIQTLSDLRQAQCCDHFPGEPVPGTEHPLSEVFPCNLAILISAEAWPKVANWAFGDDALNI